MTHVLLTFEHLVFLEFFLDVSELSRLADINTGFRLAQLAHMDVPIFLVPLSLEEFAAHWDSTIPSKHINS